MKLQILIPQYKETEETIAPLLQSIAIQQGIDLDEVGVIICNDGSDVKLCVRFLNSFPYKIEYIQQEHKGVSAARNACLDHATADYVAFCDSDDLYYNACGLYIIFREMQQGDGFNAMSSIFIEETRDPKTHERVYINRQNDMTFVHGKIYRRKFLLKNNIRFNDSLTIHEDSYFNCLAQRIAGEVKYCQTPFYLWKWRDDSVCRHDPKYILKTYNNMLDSNTALVQEFIDRGRTQDAQFYATSMIYDAYYTMNKDEWINQENQMYRDNTEKRFKQYYMQFKPQFDSIPQEYKQQIIVSMRNRFFGEGMFMESVTFADWIKHIMELDV